MRRDRHLKQADHYFDAKDFKKAEIEYLNVLRLAPTNVWVIERLATIYYDQGKTEQAARFLAAARQLDKDNTQVRTRFAEVLLSARQFKQVREEAIYVLDRSPTNEDALVLLADASVTPKDIVDSQQRLQKLATQSGNRAAWHLAMAGLLLRQTNTAAADAALRKAIALEPQSPRVNLAWGAFYWLQKDLKNADVYFQKAAQLAPPNSPLGLRWVEFKLATGSIKEAHEVLTQITTKAPDFTAAWALLSKVDFDLQNFQECSNIVQKVLLQDSGNVQARMLHAGLQRVTGQPAAAVKELEALKRSFNGSPEINYELALACLRNHELGKAAQSAEEALKLNPNYAQATMLLAEVNIQRGEAATAITALQDLVQKQPELLRAQLLLGSAYSAKARFDDALTIYSGIENRFPDNPAIPFLIGLTLRQQANRNAEARKAFEKAAALSTNDFAVSYQLVDLEIAEKDYPAASARVRQLLLQNPKSAGAKFLEARVFLAQTNLVEAEKALQQALEWEPDFGPAYNLLTLTYVAANKLPEALEKLQQVLDKNGKNVKVLMEMAMILEKKGDLTQSVKKYEELLKVAPDFTPALNNLAYLLSEKLGNTAEAYARATRARELAPDDPNTADTLGWIHFRRREYSRALFCLQQSAAKLPQESEVQYHLGMTFYMMGQEQPARAAFKRALERNQDFVGRAEAQRRLALLDLDPNATDQAAVTALQDQIRQQPDDLPALMRLGRIYARTGAPDKARQTYEDARKANPNSALVLLQLADLNANSLKNPQQALVLAREARKLAPDDPEVAHLLGRLAAQTGEHEWASSLLQESAQKLPNNPEVLFDLAHALYSVAKVNEAEDTMRRARSQPGTPNSELETLKTEAQTFLNLLTLSKSPDQRLQAEPQVQALLKVRPDYLPALMVVGLIQEQQARFPEARQTYEKIVGQNPQFAPARKQLAGLYSDQFNDQQKAQEQATKARGTMPDDPELAKTLGKIAYRRNDYRNAVRFLQESSLKRTEDPEVFYFLGLAQNQLKAKEESKRALDRALTLSPNAPFAAEARKLLADLRK